MSSGEVVDGTVVVLKMGDTRTGASAGGNGPVKRKEVMMYGKKKELQGCNP